MVRGAISVDRLADLGDVLGPGSATAPDGVDESRLGELAEQLAGRGRLLVVAAEGVGQPGVGIAEDGDGRHPREVGQVGPHLLRPERAVDADRERFGVRDRDPECLDRLAGQVAAASVDDRDRDHQGQLRRGRPGGSDRRLPVQGVEDRLHQQEVGAAIAEASRRLGITLVELVVGDRPVGRIVDLGRDREGDVGGAERTGDEAVRVAGDGPSRDLRARPVHLIDGVLQAVVALRDRGCREGVGGHHVGAGVEVGAVQLFDKVGPRQAEHVGIALEGGRMVLEALTAVVRLGELLALEHRPDRSVEDQDPLGEKLPAAGPAPSAARFPGSWSTTHCPRSSDLGIRGGKRREPGPMHGTGPLVGRREVTWWGRG